MKLVAYLLDGAFGQEVGLLVVRVVVVLRGLRVGLQERRKAVKRRQSIR